MFQDTGAKGSIVLINTQDFPGGAAILTRRLKQALESQNYAARILVGYRKFEGSQAHSFNPLPDAVIKQAAHAQGLLYYHLQGSHHLIRHPLVRQADLLHLQNVHGDYFNPFSLPALSGYKPTIWTMHDMWALTGHCAHALDCPKWETGCGDCPDLAVYPAVSKDATARLWQDKRTIYKYSRLWIVCPSQWLADKATRSILRSHPVTVIMNAVDTAVFRPQDKKIARRKLNLPEETVIIGASAHGGLDNPWKGGAFALEAALALHKVFPSMLFVAAGGGKNAPFDYIRCLPHLDTEEEMALYHASLDFTLFTSIADTCPLTLIESLSCGTPVVGFATGGAPEIVRDGQDGLMVPVGDVQALVQAATVLITKPALREKMGKKAAEDAAVRFSLERMGTDYIKLYEEVLASARPTPPRLPDHLVPALVRTPDYVNSEQILMSHKKYPSEILLYHRISSAIPDNQMLSVTPENFDAHLAILTAERKVLPLYDMLKYFDGGHEIFSSVSITFDDGYADNFIEALPMLEKHKCHATIFVTAGLLGNRYGFWYDVIEDIFFIRKIDKKTIFIPSIQLTLPIVTIRERIESHELLFTVLKNSPARLARIVIHELLLSAEIDPISYRTPQPILTESQLKELAASPWIEIGTHTLTHPLLSSLDRETQSHEILGSIKKLEECIGKKIRMIAYPYGNRGAYNDTTREIVQRAGILGIANIQDSIALPFSPTDTPRRLVRNWDGKQFRLWLRSNSKYTFEQELHDSRLDRLYRHMKECDLGFASVAAPRKTEQQNIEVGILPYEPTSRLFGFDRGTPIDRIYIERFLDQHKEAITGRVLEVGDDSYTKKFGAGVTKSDVINAVPSPKATIVGDFTSEGTIPADAFNCIIVTQTVHLIYDYKNALRNIYASLAKNGMLLLTAPGISQISRYDMERWGDFWRFTDASMQRSLEECMPGASISVKAFGNYFSSVSFLDGRAAEELDAAAFGYDDRDYQLLITASVIKADS